MTEDQASMLEVGDNVYFSCHVDSWDGKVIKNGDGYVDILWDWDSNVFTYGWNELNYYHKIQRIT